MNTMSSHLDSLPSPAPSEPSAPVSFGATVRAVEPGEHLASLVRLVMRAATSREALRQAAEYLQQQYRGVCILLETREDDAVRHESFGAEITFNGFAAPALPAAYPHVILPLKDVEGAITYVFALDNPDAPSPSFLSSLSGALLDTLTACLSLRIANEGLRRRAEQSEKTATRRLREVAAIYDIGQALAPVPNAPMLQMIVERTALLMEAQACSLMLVDAAQNRLRVAASHGLPPDVRAPDSAARRGRGRARGPNRRTPPPRQQRSS